MEEERDRPIDEQFPFVRLDIDKMSKNIDKLERSTRRLDCYNKNRDTELEVIIQKWLINHFQKQKYQVENLHDNIKNGEILNDTGDKPIVQWDAIVAVKKENEKLLYFVETKTTPHINDILGDNQNTLKSRINRTKDFIQNLNFDNISGNTKNQRAVFKNYQDYEIVVCYASRNIDEWIKKGLEQFRVDTGIRTAFIVGNFEFSLKDADALTLIEN